MDEFTLKKKKKEVYLSKLFTPKSEMSFQWYKEIQ